MSLVLFFMQNAKNKKIKSQLEKLEVEKNKINSTPIVPELSKVESYLKNEKLEAMYNNWKETPEILSYIDVLVDGKFEEDKKNIKLRFRGSSNQRIIDVKKSLKENKAVLFEF